MNLNFLKPKWKNPDPLIRMEAVKKLSNQNILVTIAKNDTNIDIRKEAIGKLMDENILADILKSCDFDYSTQKEISAKLKDENILADIAKNKNVDTFVRKEVIENITDNSILSDLVINGGAFITDTALEKLTDYQIILEFAKEEFYQKIFKAEIYPTVPQLPGKIISSFQGNAYDLWNWLVEIRKNDLRELYTDITKNYFRFENLRNAHILYFLFSGLIKKEDEPHDSQYDEYFTSKRTSFWVLRIYDDLFKWFITKKNETMRT